MMQSIVYPIGDSLYLNITNRCTNQCSFCIRNKARLFNGKYPLWLEHEPSAEEIFRAIGDPSQYKQIVFCGYGEPLIRLDVVKVIASRLSFGPKSLRTRSSLPRAEAPRDEAPRAEAPHPSLRIDTNGHANLFWGRDILPELKDLIDIMSVSLDAENADVYARICSPAFGKKAYAAIIDFIKEAKKYIPEVEATAVDLPMINIEACKKIAEDLGVSFRVRPYYEATYIR